MAEHLDENGNWQQGYYCCRCGDPTNMMGSGHEKCKPNPERVKKIQEVNKRTREEGWE